MKKTARQIDVGFRSKARKSVIENALQIPFQGIAHVGRGRDRFKIRAGLFGAKNARGTIRFGANIVF